MKNFFENVTNVIGQFHKSLDNWNELHENAGKKDIDFVNSIDFELAKAFILDWEDVAVKMAKMILAHKDISDIKVKVE